MQTEEYQRKIFSVNVVEVTFENAAEAAEWCDGKVELATHKMLGNIVKLPSVKVPGTGLKRGRFDTANLGDRIVEHNGNFRVYKPHAFKGMFEKKEFDGVLTGLLAAQEDTTEMSEELRTTVFDTGDYVASEVLVGEDHPTEMA